MNQGFKKEQQPTHTQPEEFSSSSKEVKLRPKTTANLTWKLKTRQ